MNFSHGLHLNLVLFSCVSRLVKLLGRRLRLDVVAADGIFPPDEQLAVGDDGVRPVRALPVSRDLE